MLLLKTRTAHFLQGGVNSATKSASKLLRLRLCPSLCQRLSGPPTEQSGDKQNGILLQLFKAAGD